MIVLQQQEGWLLSQGHACCRAPCFLYVGRAPCAAFPEETNTHLFTPDLY